MRVAIIYYSVYNKKKIENIAKTMVAPLENKGHNVTLINIQQTDKSRLSIYEFLIIGTESLSFFSSKISIEIKNYLNQVGNITGKKCYVWVIKKFFNQKTLNNLMKLLESQGLTMYLSDYFISKKEAENCITQLKI